MEEGKKNKAKTGSERGRGKGGRAMNGKRMRREGEEGWVKNDKKGQETNRGWGRGRTEEYEKRGEGRMGSRREGRKRKGRGEERGIG